MHTDSSVCIFCCLLQSHILTYTRTHTLVVSCFLGHWGEREGRRQGKRAAGLLSVSHGQADCPQASIHHLHPPTTSTPSSHSSMLHSTGHTQIWIHAETDRHGFKWKKQMPTSDTYLEGLTTLLNLGHALLKHQNSNLYINNHPIGCMWI